MLTVTKLTEGGLLHLRPSLDGRVERRKFYFLKLWQDGLEVLPTHARVGLVHKPGARAVVEALVDDFVSGRPRAELVRPQGSGMDPPFQRMWEPDEAIVEMRTKATRTFGFFHRENEFVAVLLVLTANLKQQLGEPDKTGQKARYKQCATHVERLIGRLDPKEVDLRDVEELVTDC